MPTPFTHLRVAEQIREQLRANGRFYELLQREWPAFYLGSVAPDVQTVTGMPRPQTHFYELPPAPENMAYPRMLATYPELSAPETLLPAQAIFVAAYCAHLLLDLVWFREILIPYFAEATGMGEFPQRRLLHHALLTHLDRLAYSELPATAVTTLAAAEPRGWLPFVTDTDLCAWRDLLVEQLEPDAASQTVLVYARRLEMLPGEFATLLDDPVWMDETFYDQVPVTAVQQRLETAVAESVALVVDYLSPIV